MASIRGFRMFATNGLKAAKLSSSISCLNLKHKVVCPCYITQTRSLVDFTTTDVLGILKYATIDSQNDITKDIKEADKETLVTALALLHNKEAALPSGKDFESLLTSLVSGLSAEEFLFVDQSVHVDQDQLVRSTPAKVKLFSTEEMQDLEFMLRSKISRGKVVIIEHGTNTSSIRRLRRLCDVAERTNTKVILTDPNGTILYRHLSGDSVDLLNVLKRPHVICSNLDLISPSNKVNYVSGSKEMIAKLNRHKNELSANLLQGLLQGFSLLPSLASQGYQSLCRSLKLKSALEDMGLRVKVSGFTLQVKLDPVFASKAVAQLWDSGIKVSLINAENLSGISVSVTADHTDTNVRDLILSLASVIRLPVEDYKAPLSRFYTFAKANGAHEAPSWMHRKELSILESLYCYDKRADLQDTTPRTSLSLVLDDAFDTGLI